jgi:integrase
VSHPLTYELRCLLLAHKEGSYSTQASRRHILTHLGEQLAAKFPHMHAPELKGRHTTYLLDTWRAEGLSTGTIKNRMSVLRWWCRHIGNAGLLRHPNEAYGIGRRSGITTVNKARVLDPGQLGQVKSAYIRMSLRLQAQFGLRREESLKIRPHQADHGDTLVLQASWCKGGRDRAIPIETADQRACLDEAKRLVNFKQASLIPKDRSYKQQLNRFVHACRTVGISHVHGLRHQFAQTTFEALAGFPCPLAGGPHAAALTPAQREIDADVRQYVAEILGHGRAEVTKIYLGA